MIFSKYKKVFLGLFLFAIASSGMALSVFNPTVTLKNTLENNYKTQIENFLENYTNAHDTIFLVKKFKYAHTKITKLLKKNTLNNEMTFVIEYIDYALQVYIEEHKYDTENNNILNDNKKEDEQKKENRSINTENYRSGTKSIIAGEESKPIIKFELIANHENIIIEDFSFSTTEKGFGQAIKMLRIYNTDGEFIAEKDPHNQKVSFKNIFTTLKVGSNAFYITLEPDTTGYGENGVMIHGLTLTLDIENAKGETSGEKIHIDPVKNSTDVITTTPLLIENIKLLDIYEGYRVDDRLYNQARADLAIISIDIPDTKNKEEDSSNDISIILDTLNFELKDNSIGQSIKTNIKLQRIDSYSTPISPSNITNNIVSFDLKQLSGNRNQINKNKTAIFLVTGTPLLDSSKIETITIELDTNNLPEGVFTYRIPGSDIIFNTKSYTPSHIGSSIISSR